MPMKLAGTGIDVGLVELVLVVDQVDAVAVDDVGRLELRRLAAHDGEPPRRGSAGPRTPSPGAAPGARPG